MASDILEDGGEQLLVLVVGGNDLGGKQVHERRQHRHQPADAFVVARREHIVGALQYIYIQINNKVRIK